MEFFTNITVLRCVTILCSSQLLHLWPTARHPAGYEGDDCQLGHRLCIVNELS